MILVLRNRRIAHEFKVSLGYAVGETLSANFQVWDLNQFAGWSSTVLQGN